MQEAFDYPNIIREPLTWGMEDGEFCSLGLCHASIEQRAHAIHQPGHYSPKSLAVRLNEQAVLREGGFVSVLGDC